MRSVIPTGSAGEPDRWSTQTSHLPHLTHLDFVGSVPREILYAVLERFQTQQIVANLHLPLGRMTAQSLHRKLQVEDARFFIMPFFTFPEDWEEGARDGADFWVRADEFVEAKRRGEVDGACLVIYWVAPAGAHPFWGFIAAKFWTDDDMRRKVTATRAGARSSVSLCRERRHAAFRSLASRAHRWKSCLIPRLASRPPSMRCCVPFTPPYRRGTYSLQFIDLLHLPSRVARSAAPVASSHSLLGDGKGGRLAGPRRPPSPTSFSCPSSVL